MRGALCECSPQSAAFNPDRAAFWFDTKILRLRLIGCALSQADSGVPQQVLQRLAPPNLPPRAFSAPGAPASLLAPSAAAGPLRSVIVTVATAPLLQHGQAQAVQEATRYDQHAAQADTSTCAQRQQ